MTLEGISSMTSCVRGIRDGHTTVIAVTGLLWIGLLAGCRESGCAPPPATTANAGSTQSASKDGAAARLTVGRSLKPLLVEAAEQSAAFINAERFGRAYWTFGVPAGKPKRFLAISDRDTGVPLAGGSRGENFVAEEHR